MPSSPRLYRALPPALRAWPGCAWRWPLSASAASRADLASFWAVIRIVGDERAGSPFCAVRHQTRAHWPQKEKTQHSTSHTGGMMPSNSRLYRTFSCARTARSRLKRRCAWGRAAHFTLSAFSSVAERENGAMKLLILLLVSASAAAAARPLADAAADEL